MTRVKQHTRKGKTVKAHNRSVKRSISGAGQEFLSHKAKSSFISDFQHQPHNNTLVVKMQDGRQYIYSGVTPEVYKKMTTYSKRYKSMGKAYHKYVRGQYPAGG